MDAILALQRFGLGPRYDLPADFRQALTADPRGALRSELSASRPLIEQAALPATAEALWAVFEQQQAKKALRDEMQTARNPTGLTAANADTSQTAEAMQLKAMHVQRDIFLDEAQARFEKAYAEPTGLTERLVWFWANHFAVSVAKGLQVRATAGAFEREAIRPHVLGHFTDMLLAVEQHPAMLFYLDNRDSIGPNSKAGQRRNKGLNENLAREILELHTLGVGSGYNQTDVTNLARIITGWTVSGLKDNARNPGQFMFNPNWHEPGSFKVLAKTYAESGQQQGEAVLRDLAAHPATAKHLATKFAKHFVSDEPPPTLVEKLQLNFLQTGGDLKSFTETLVSADEAWQAAHTKLRQPQVYLMAASRALNLPIEKPQPFLGALKALGQPLWEPSGPNGFGDREQDWASPEGLKLRLGYASLMSGQAKLADDPRSAVSLLLGETASAETTQAIARAESRQQGLALLLMSPEFQHS